MHDLSVIITLAGALAVALVMGGITRSLGLSTLVGYLLAGVAVGPFTPGFVADTRLAQQMAEIGVILLMFSVGMHFHPQESSSVRGIAVPGAVCRASSRAWPAGVSRGFSAERHRRHRLRHVARGGEHGGADAHAGCSRTGSPRATGTSRSAG